jgi:hypothetical protein
MRLDRIRDLFGIPVSTLMVAATFAMTLIIGTGDAFARERVSGERPDHRLTTDDYYRGIFLGQGPVAERIPVIHDNLRIDPSKHDPRVLRVIHDFQARLVDSIRTSDPAFMTRFASAIRSGDHFAIEEAIGDGARVTVKAVQEMPEIVALRHQVQNDPQYANRLVEQIRAASGNKADEAQIRQALNMLVAGATLDSIAGPKVGNHAFVVALAVVAAIVAATYIAVVHAVAGAFSVALAGVIAVEFAAWTPWNKDMLASEGLFREQLVDAIAQMNH